MFSLVLLSTVLALPMPQGGSTLRTPGQYPTIQSAIDVANKGDTVLVAPGTYKENIDFKGKAITVRSSGGSAVTTIDGDQKGTVVSFVTAEGLDSVLEGFTITNGSGSYVNAMGGMIGGGGILCKGSSPTIRDNVVSGNKISSTRTVGAGGIGCYNGASPRIVRNVVTRNSITSSGGAAGGGGIGCLDNCSPSILDNTISLNSATGAGAVGAGGLLVQWYGKPTIARNRIFQNTAAGGGGGGMQCNYSVEPTLVDNVIFENTADYGGGIQFWHARVAASSANNTIYGNTAKTGGGGVFCNSDSIVVMRDTIVWGNTAPSGPQIYVTGTASLTISHSDVEGGKSNVYVASTAKLNWGAGMLDARPLFADPSKRDFSLLSGSPCIDAGDPATSRCLDTDLVGNPRQLDGRLDGKMRVDMGAHEFDNVHLAVSGTWARGSQVTLHTTGKAGLSVLLAVTTKSGRLCLPGVGGIFLDPGTPWTLAGWGTVPSSVQIDVPLSVPAGLSLVLQEVAFVPSTRAGNASNAVHGTIQ